MYKTQFSYFQINKTKVEKYGICIYQIGSLDWRILLCHLVEKLVEKGFSKRVSMERGSCSTFVGKFSAAKLRDE